MVCTIRGKLSHFCIGRAQSIQCAVTQDTTAVRRALTDTYLVNSPLKPNIDYAVGCITKKWFSCQWNQPFEEDVSYCLSWPFVIVRALVKSKATFSDPPIIMQNSMMTAKLLLTGHSSAGRQC